jgi:hypothetical protein
MYILITTYVKRFTLHLDVAAWGVLHVIIKPFPQRAPRIPSSEHLKAFLSVLLHTCRLACHYERILFCLFAVRSIDTEKYLRVHPRAASRVRHDDSDGILMHAVHNLAISSSERDSSQRLRQIKSLGLLVEDELTEPCAILVVQIKKQLFLVWTLWSGLFFALACVRADECQDGALEQTTDAAKVGVQRTHAPLLGLQGEVDLQAGGHALVHLQVGGIALGLRRSFVAELADRHFVFAQFLSRLLLLDHLVAARAESFNSVCQMQQLLPRAPCESLTHLRQLSLGTHAPWTWEGAVAAGYAVLTTQHSQVTAAADIKLAGQAAVVDLQLERTARDKRICSHQQRFSDSSHISVAVSTLDQTELMYVGRRLRVVSTVRHDESYGSNLHT